MIRAASRVPQLLHLARRCSHVHRIRSRGFLSSIWTDPSSNRLPQYVDERPHQIRWHGGPSVSADAPTVTVTFLQPDGTPRSVDARVGESLLQTAHRHDIDLEGACEGVCACSTCHLILPHELYDQLDEPSEDEEDMLDMAFGLEETSRLGCQITVTPDMDGVELKMPAATRNFYVDGHVPKPH